MGFNSAFKGLRGKYSLCSGVLAASGIVLCCRCPVGGSFFLHLLHGRGLSGLIAVDYDVSKAAHCQDGSNTV